MQLVQMIAHRVLHLLHCGAYRIQLAIVEGLIHHPERFFRKLLVRHVFPYDDEPCE